MRPFSGLLPVDKRPCDRTCHGWVDVAVLVRINVRMVIRRYTRLYTRLPEQAPVRVVIRPDERSCAGPHVTHSARLPARGHVRTLANTDVPGAGRRPVGENVRRPFREPGGGTFDNTPPHSSQQSPVYPFGNTSV